MVFCNSSLKGPRQFGFHLTANNKCWAHIPWRTKGRTKGCALSDCIPLSVLPKALPTGLLLHHTVPWYYYGGENRFLITHIASQGTTAINQGSLKRKKGWAHVSRQLWAVSAIACHKEVIGLDHFDHLRRRKTRCFLCASLWYSKNKAFRLILNVRKWNGDVTEEKVIYLWNCSCINRNLFLLSHLLSSWRHNFPVSAHNSICWNGAQDSPFVCESSPIWPSPVLEFFLQYLVP